MKTKSSLLPAWLRHLALFALPVVSALAAAPAYDFYLCAALNKGFVTGSKITTISGLFKRDDAGKWVHIGYNDLSVSSAAFDPRDPNVIYVSALNGCWRTLDGGKSWRQTNDWSITEGREVAVDHNAPDNIYLALPDGVAVSSDRAQTWVRKENGLPERGKYTQTVKVDRAKSGRVLAGCESGIYLTENGGGSWKRVLKTKATVVDVEQAYNDPKQWVAVTERDGAWASIDGGQSWKKFPGVPSDHPLYNITFDPTNARRLAISSWVHGVLTTEDSGATWTDRNAGLPPPHCVVRTGVDPDSGRLYASVVGESLYTSDDFGRTWKRDALEGSAISNFITVPKAAK